LVNFAALHRESILRWMCGTPLADYLADVNQECRELSLSAAIAVVTGESVALGIFLTPAAMARSLGSPLLLAMVWCGLGLMALCGALCYTELAVRYPASGGEYVYLRHGFGDTAAGHGGLPGDQLCLPLRRSDRGHELRHLRSSVN
jgi:hypothetical protein